MIDNKSVIAIIPARGGSKGIPRKNIKDLHGKPLIVWTIDAALSSKYIDKVVVTSDDDEILTIAKKYGTDIIKRPITLATDESPSVDTITHTLEQMDSFDLVMLLQPTSPLRTYVHIDESLELMMINKANSIVSVSKVKESPYWMYEINGTLLKPLLERNDTATRRQDLPTVYKLNGAIYISGIEYFKKNKSMVTKDSVAYIMPENESYDIDTHLDFLICQYEFERSKS